MNWRLQVPTLVVVQLLVFSSLWSSAMGELPDTFGAAHLFHPLPDTAVGAHCKWEVKLNTVYNRIPSTITEILCSDPNESCGGNSNYRCRQIRSKMVVAYTDDTNLAGTDFSQSISLLNRRNTTVSIGCSCVLRQSDLVETYVQTMINKRGGGGGSSPAVSRVGVNAGSFGSSGGNYANSGGLPIIIGGGRRPPLN